MRLRALLAASAALVAFAATSAWADDLEDCLAKHQRDCIVEIVLATARAKPDPIDRITALAQLAVLMAQDDDADEGVEYMELADIAARDIAEPLLKEEADFALAEGHAKVGDFDAALAAVDRIEDPARKQFAVSTIAVTAGEFAALDVLQRLLPTLEDQLADEVKEDIAEYFHEQKDWDRLIEVTSTLVFWTPDLARWVLADLVSVNRFPDALHLYELIPIALKDFGGRGLVDGFIQVRNFDLARQIALAIANRSQYHSDAALADVAEAAANAGNRALADSIIASIFDGETKGDALVKLAGVLASKGDIAGANKIADEAKANPPPMRSPAAVQRLPRLVYAAIAHAQAVKGDVAGAIASTRQIDDAAEREVALAEVAKRRLDARDNTGALIALDALTSSPPANLNTLREAVSDLARAGQAPRAVALAAALPQPADQLQTLARAAAAVTERRTDAVLLLDAAAQRLEALPANRREATVARLAAIRAMAGDVPAAAAAMRSLSEDRRTEALLAVAFPEIAPLP